MPKQIQDNLSKILQVKNAANDTAELYFYGDIVSSWWGAWDDTDQYPESVKRFLDGAKGKNLNIYINSGGGSVFAGMAIYNMLKRHQGFKTAYVDGLAASISSVIPLAADKVVIPGNAYYMVHKPLIDPGFCNANDLRKMAGFLDVIEEGIINAYSEHLVPGVNIESIKEMVNAETWLTGDQAARYFNFEASAPVKAAAYVGPLDQFINVPKNLQTEGLAEAKARFNLLKLKGEER